MGVKSIERGLELSRESDDSLDAQLPTSEFRFADTRRFRPRVEHISLIRHVILRSYPCDFVEEAVQAHCQHFTLASKWTTH